MRAVGHDEIDRPGLLDGVACVITCARHPLLGRDGYEPATMDPDLRMARRIGGREIAYLMLSSRKVYAPAAGRSPRARRSRPPTATAATSSPPSSGCASCSASA